MAATGRTSTKQEVVIVGGGLIGLSVARELAGRGCEVTVLDRQRLFRGASAVAAGMLAAQIEWDRPNAFFRLALYSRALYADWVQQLEEETGRSIGYRKTGILQVAFHLRDVERFQEKMVWQQQRGLHAEWIEEADLPGVEPELSRRALGALFAPDDHQVDSGKLVRALYHSAVSRGVRVVTGAKVSGIVRNGERVVGVQTAQGIYPADDVVVAAGSWSGEPLTGGCGTMPVRPVRGTIVEVRGRPRLLRHIVFTDDCYIVPKGGNRYLIGATVEEAGFTQKAELGSVRTLLEKASTLFPAVDYFHWHTVRSGLRPTTPDLQPILGPDPRVERLWWACGHYRNGVLLTPVTGKIMAQLLHGEEPAVDVTSLAPNRFCDPHDGKRDAPDLPSLNRA